MTDMMSDMKSPDTDSDAPPDTFTVREMSRNTAGVLKASLVHGQVRIKSRGGPTFLLTPDRAGESADDWARGAAEFATRQREYREKLRLMGARPPETAEETEYIHRIIAGEE